MHIKFLHHGTGDPHGAATYLLSECDHRGVLRPEVKVLRGNPTLLASLASSLRTVHRYTSAVIAWSPEDQPTPGEVNEVLDDFERLAFAGLEPDQYCHSVVSHGSHVHIIVARVDLRSGRSMNIAPPPWRGHFDHLRDHWNHKVGWARPDDPSRARLVRLDAASSRKLGQSMLEVERVSERTGFSVADLLHTIGVEPWPKKVIADRLLNLVCEGQVKNRQDVLAALVEYGSVHRKGKDYISIRLAEDEKPVRFKGAIFHQDFEASAVLIRASSPSLSGRSEPNLMAAEAAKREMGNAISARAAYNRSRFPAPKPRPTSARNPIERDDQEQLIQSTIEVQQNERDRNAVVKKAERVFRRARTSMAGLVRVCLKAVGDFESAECAIAAAQRAISAAQRLFLETERACRRVDKAIAAVKSDDLKLPAIRRKF